MVDQPILHRCPINYSKCATAMLTSTPTEKHLIPMFWHKALRYSGKQKLHPQFSESGWGMWIPFFENLGFLIKTRMSTLMGKVLPVCNVTINPNFCHRASLFLLIFSLWYKHTLWQNDFCPSSEQNSPPACGPTMAPNQTRKPHENSSASIYQNIKYVHVYVPMRKKVQISEPYH